LSTRANIYVKDAGPNFEEILLYQHSDGYPSTVLPALAKAQEHGLSLPILALWKAGRAGYASGLVLLAGMYEYEGAKVPSMQPLSYLELHGDIDYLYILHVSQTEWSVEVRLVDSGFDGGAIDGALRHTKLLVKGSPMALVEQGWVEPSE